MDGAGNGYPDGVPRYLERQVVSDAGTRYQVRPIRPGDAPGLMAFHRHLDGRSVYLRFFSFHPELTAGEAEHFACVDHVDRLALVAEFDGHLIAVGRYERGPGETEAEVAFVVSDAFQHHGIGTVLLDELARAARERGILTFRAETLAENRPMLDVFHHAGFVVTSSVDYGTVSLRFSIEITDAYRDARDRREAERADRLVQARRLRNEEAGGEGRGAQPACATYERCTPRAANSRFNS